MAATASLQLSPQQQQQIERMNREDPFYKFNKEIINMPMFTELIGEAEMTQLNGIINRNFSPQMQDIVRPFLEKNNGKSYYLVSAVLRKALEIDHNKRMSFEQKINELQIEKYDSAINAMDTRYRLDSRLETLESNYKLAKQYMNIVDLFNPYGKTRDTSQLTYLKKLKKEHSEIYKSQKIMKNESTVYIEQEGNKFIVNEKNKCGSYSLYIENDQPEVNISSLKFNYDEKQCMMPFDELMEIVLDKVDDVCNKSRLDNIKVTITDASYHEIISRDADYKLMTIILKLTDEYTNTPSIYDKYGFVSEYASLDVYKFLMHQIKVYVQEYRSLGGYNLYSISDGLQKLTKKNIRSYCERTQDFIEERVDDFYKKKFVYFIEFMYKKFVSDLYGKIISRGIETNEIIETEVMTPKREELSNSDGFEESGFTTKYKISKNSLKLTSFYNNIFEVFELQEKSEESEEDSDDEPLIFIEKFFNTSIFTELVMIHNKIKRSAERSLSSERPAKRFLGDTVDTGTKTSDRSVMRFQIQQKTNPSSSAAAKPGGYSTYTWFHHCY